MAICDCCKFKYIDDELTGVFIRKNRQIVWGHLCPDCLDRIQGRLHRTEGCSVRHPGSTNMPGLFE